uniref:Zasp-like motif domain-containing protein n=1 Tax=Syphacia muris TaxID=451379 RepID=A0A0N5AIM6_9BILA
MENNQLIKQNGEMKSSCKQVLSTSTANVVDQHSCLKQNCYLNALPNNIITPVNQRYIQSIAPSFPQPDSLPTFAGKPIQPISLVQVKNAGLQNVLPHMITAPSSSNFAEDVLAEELANKLLNGDLQNGYWIPRSDKTYASPDINLEILVKTLSLRHQKQLAFAKTEKLKSKVVAYVFSRYRRSLSYFKVVSRNRKN